MASDYFTLIDPSPTHIYTLSLHDALPISLKTKLSLLPKKLFRIRMSRNFGMKMLTMTNLSTELRLILILTVQQECRDRKSGSAGMPRPISYAVFCLKKKRCCLHRQRRAAVCAVRRHEALLAFG